MNINNKLGRAVSIAALGRSHVGPLFASMVLLTSVLVIGVTAPPSSAAVRYQVRAATSPTLVVDRVGHVTGAVAPSAVGQRVFLQRLTGRTWRTLASAVLDRRSRYDIPYRISVAGKFSLRVFKLGTSVALAGSSPSISVATFALGPDGCPTGSSPPPAPSALTLAEQATVLALHNQFRDEVRAGESHLTWDPAIAANAQGWANLTAPLGKLCHIPGGFSGQGENLGEAASIEAVVKLWYSEKSKYHGEVVIFPSPQGTNYHLWGHYTQMAWKNTLRIGCGRAPWPQYGNVLLVCRYYPAGNVNGQRPY